MSSAGTQSQDSESLIDSVSVFFSNYSKSHGPSRFEESLSIRNQREIALTVVNEQTGHFKKKNKTEVLKSTEKYPFNQKSTFEL